MKTIKNTKPDEDKRIVINLQDIIKNQHIKSKKISIRDLIKTRCDKSRYSPLSTNRFHDIKKKVSSIIFPKCKGPRFQFKPRSLSRK